MMKAGLLVGYFTLMIGQTIEPIAPDLSVLIQGGAVGVLAWVAWCQRAEIREQRIELTAIRREHSEVIATLCSRWDQWERVRHDDSEKLDGAIRDMTRHCAESIHTRLETPRGK